MTSTMDAMMPSIPGSFVFQHDRNNYNNKSHNFFQPPAPSPSPSQRSQIPRPVSRSSNSSSRKRPRLDTNTSYFSRPTRPAVPTRSSTSTSHTLGGSYDHISYNNLNSSTYSLDGQCPLSPSPLANSEYRLAGGLDTPSASLQRGLEELEQNEAEQDYRPNRYNTTNTSLTTLSLDGSDRFNRNSQKTSFRSADADSKKRTRSSHRHTGSLTGWGIRSTAWALTGGLAGRMFNFCVSTAFRGFGAGAGDTYQWDTAKSEFDSGYSSSMHSNANLFSNHNRISHNLPGSYTADFGGFVEDYMNSPEMTKRTSDYTPTASRVRLNDMSTIKNDWEIIDQAGFVESDSEPSPVRKRSRASVAGGWERPVSRNSLRTTGTGASHASSRAATSLPSPSHQRAVSSVPFQPVRRVRPSVGGSRRSHSYHPSINTFVTGVGNKSPERPSSSASMRRNRNDSTKTDCNFNADLSPEVHNYKRKLQQREKSQDENLKRLNAQLRDMIREGKEALGSKVEILDGHSHDDGGYIDEGYYEDDWR